MAQSLDNQSRNGRGGVLTAKGEATRLRLVAAGQAVFGELGYDQASISEITRRAGVSQGTFYLYFTSKQEIFSELVRQIGRDLRHTVQEAILGLTARVDIERAGYKAFLNFVRDNPAIYRIVRQAEFVDRDAFRDYYESFATGYIARLRASAAAGDIRDIDPEVVAWCLMGIGDLVGMRWILLGDGETVPSRVIDTMVDLIFHGLAPKSYPQSD